MKTHKELKFYRISQALLTSMLSLISLTSYAGGEKGDASNTVYCNGSDTDLRFPKSGYYMLDYAIEESKNHSWHMENQDPIKNLELIASRLNVVVPLKMSKDKDSAYPLYGNDLLNFPYMINQWIPTDIELHNSEFNKSSDSINSLLNEQLCPPKTIKQIVSYKTGDYFYNKTGYNEVIEAKIVKGSNKDLGPLQKSILWTHELLRGANFSTKEIWKWVRVLHSTEFFRLEKFELIKYLFDQKLLNADEYDLQRFYHYVVDARRRDLISWAEKLNELFQGQLLNVKNKFKLIEVVESQAQCSALKEARDYFVENNPGITNQKIQFLHDYIKKSWVNRGGDRDALRISFFIYGNSVLDYELMKLRNSYEEKYRCPTK